MHDVDRVTSIASFRTSFPMVNYKGLKPWIEEVRLGKASALLPEPVAGWVMTRGSTGRSKVIPTTETHLSEILYNGARAMVNFARRKDPSVLGLGVLSINHPSLVQSISTPAGEERFGYSSGTYAKLFPSIGSTGLVPRQEELDALGGDAGRKDWEKRFEWVYEKARRTEIGSAIGVTTILLSFAKYVRGEFHVFPKDIWKMKALFCTSVAKIHTRFAPMLRHFYGDIPIVEMYTATEGAFAQQLDDHPYVCPNFDSYLFEVETSKGVKMLHELLPGEWGRIIISSSLFPRYDIGDYVEAAGKGYYRIIGRAGALTALEHVLASNLGRI